MSNGPWYTVKGDQIAGPFVYNEAKKFLGLASNRHNDQRYLDTRAIRVNDHVVYRYGTLFIGTIDGLLQHKVVPDRSKFPVTPAERKSTTTHIAIVRGVLVNGIIRTQTTGPWQAI